jgi:hypothetical protein
MKKDPPIIMRTDVYLKIVVEHDPPDTPQKIAAEICRQVQKVYGVRRAELSNIVTQEPPSPK